MFNNTQDSFVENLLEEKDFDINRRNDFKSSLYEKIVLGKNEISKSFLTLHKRLIIAAFSFILIILGGFFFYPLISNNQTTNTQTDSQQLDQAQNQIDQNLSNISTAVSNITSDTPLITQQDIEF